MRGSSPRSAHSPASDLRPLASVALLLAAAVFVSACTGGSRCIDTRDEGCIPQAEYEARVTELAESYRDHPGFSNQWGLAAIRADEAYAHLELADGSAETLRPGKGVVVGVIDSGIDEEHPLFEGTKLTEVLVGRAENETGERFSHGTAVTREIAAFDALGTPFWFELGDFASAPDGPSMAERLRDFMAPTADSHAFGVPALAFPNWPEGLEPGLSWAEPNPLQFGFLATSARAGSGHLSLAERASALSLVGNDDLLLTAFSTLGMDRVEPALGGALRWRPSGAALALRAGWLAERETMLGTSAQGAFGRLTSHAAFAGVESETDIAGWRVAGATEVGVATPSLDGGLLTDVSPLTTSTFAVSATRPVGDDSSFRLSVSQPLRVEDGRARLSVPVGRRKRGDVLRDALTVDLTPSGRQIDVEARWHRKGVAGGELRLGAAWTRNPGHRADAEPGLTLLAGWDRTF